MITTMLSMMLMALRGTDKDDDEKNKAQDTWYINAALNLCTNIYSENNFADNPLLMYQSLIEKQGANSLVDNAIKLSLFVTHLQDDTLKSGDHAGESKTVRQAQKMFLPMMIRNIDKIDSDLKKEKNKREKERADVKEVIQDRLKEENIEVSSKEDKTMLNTVSIYGYEDIKGIPTIDKSKYDKDENLIK